jgi:hypothetical protein
MRSLLSLQAFSTSTTGHEVVAIRDGAVFIPLSDRTPPGNTVDAHLRGMGRFVDNTVVAVTQ